MAAVVIAREIEYWKEKKREEEEKKRCRHLMQGYSKDDRYDIAVK